MPVRCLAIKAASDKAPVKGSAIRLNVVGTPLAPSPALSPCGDHMVRPSLTRRGFVQTAASATAFGLAGPSLGRGAEPKTLRMIIQTDLRILDPIVTTVYATRNHGYMVFDTLFALDDHL